MNLTERIGEAIVMPLENGGWDFFSIFEWEKKKKKRRRSRSRRRGGWVDRKTAKHGKRGKLPLSGQILEVLTGLK